MTRNIAKCRHCGDVIESLHQHHWVSCSCYSHTSENNGIWIDGGPDSGYVRCGGNPENFECVKENTDAQSK